VKPDSENEVPNGPSPAVVEQTPILVSMKGASISPGAQQIGALLEQIMYDLFCLRLAPTLEGETGGDTVKQSDIYLQCVDEKQAGEVFKLLMQFLHQGSDDMKRVGHDALQWLSVNTQVALIEAGGLKPMVETLQAGAAPAMVQFLSLADKSTEGTGVVDVARALRALAQEDAAVASLCAGSIRGLVGLMEKGVFGGKEEAARAMWSLSVINDDLKYSIAQQGALQPLVEMLYTGKEGFKDEAVGLLWSLAMHEGNVEGIIDVGASAALVKLLHQGSEVGQEAAAGVLRLCAANDNNKSSIIWAKAVEPLVDCLNLWSEGIRDQAAGALRNLGTYSAGSVYDSFIQEGTREVERLVEVRLVQSRLERMVQLPPNSGKQHLSALLERLILDLFDMRAVANATQNVGAEIGAGVGSNAAAVLTAANAAIIYGGDHPAAKAGQLVNVPISKLPDRSVLSEIDVGMPVEGQEGDTKQKGLGRTLPFIVQLLQAGTEEVQQQAAGAIRCLSLSTKIQLIDAGALKPLVDLIGSSAAEAVLDLVKSLDVGSDGGDVAELGAALARLGQTDADVAIRTDEAIRPVVQLLELGTGQGKQQAATALRSMCGVGDQIKFAIAREGAFEPLVKLLGNGTSKAKEEAIGVLWALIMMMSESNVDVNISAGPAADIAALLTCGVEASAQAAAGVLKLCSVADTNQVVIIKTGVVKTLVEILTTSTEKVKEQAAGAIISLSITDRGWCQDTWLTTAATQVESLTKVLLHDSITTDTNIKDAPTGNRQVSALLEQLVLDIAEYRAMYHAAQKGTALPEQPVVATPPPVEGLPGGEGVLVPRDSDEEPKLESESAPGFVPAKPAAGKLVEEDEFQTARLQILVELLTRGDPEVSQVCTSGLRALSVDTKVLLIEQGALAPVLTLMGSTAASALVDLLHKSSGLAGGDKAGEYAGALRGLAQNDAEVAGMALGTVTRMAFLLERGTHKGKEEAATALWNLSTINEQVKMAIVDASCVPHLVDLVNQGSPVARESAAGALWSMSVVNSNIKEVVSKCGAAGPLTELLFNGSSSAKEEACGALWSLAMRQVATPEIIAHGAAKGAVEMLLHGSEMGKESAAGLLGLCASLDANKRALFDVTCVEALVEQLHTSTSDGARVQAASAIKSLCTYHSAVPRAVERGAQEVDELIHKVMPTSGKQLVGAVMQDTLLGGVPQLENSLANAPQAPAVSPLAPVLEQLAYDLFDMATAAAVESAKELGEAIPQGVADPTGRNRSAKPLIDLIRMGSEAQRADAVGGMMCLSVNTKMAIIEGGALPEMVEMLGSGAAKAIVQLLAGSVRQPDGSGVMDRVEALWKLAEADPRVASVSVGCVPGLVDLLQRGNVAGKEQAAGALYYLRHMNPQVEPLLQQSGATEQLVEVLGMGTAAGKETPTMLVTLWGLLTMREGTHETVSEATASNLVQLLYTGTEVGKEGAARVMRLCGSHEGNRSAIMRARAVEPLVELLQNAGNRVRDECAGALLALSNQTQTTQSATSMIQNTIQVAQQATAGDSGGGSWWSSFFGGAGEPAVASTAVTQAVATQAATEGSYGNNEAQNSAGAEISELVGMLRSVETGVNMPVMSGSGTFQRQRKAAARLEQLMYYIFHAKTSYIVM